MKIYFLVFLFSQRKGSKNMVDYGLEGEGIKRLKRKKVRKSSS